MVEVIDEGIHDLQSAISEDQDVLTREEDCSVFFKLRVWVVVEQLFIEPKCAEATVKDVTEVFIAKVFGFDVIAMLLVDLPHTLPSYLDLLADMQVRVFINHMQFMRSRAEILILLLYDLHKFGQLLILLHFQLVILEEP